MTKCFLPTPAVWPDFLGPVVDRHNMAEIQVSDYLMVIDADGTTGMRMDAIYENSYSMTVLYPSGFKEKICLPRTNLYGKSQIVNADGEHLFSFIFNPANEREMHLFKKDCPEYVIIDKIFDRENRPEFSLGPHRTKQVNKIDIQTWPEKEPIFIVDIGRNQRIIFLQEVFQDDRRRQLLEYYRSGWTNKILATKHYIVLDDQFEVGQDISEYHDLNGYSKSLNKFINIRVYA